jgi:hypothetical protein
MGVGEMKAKEILERIQGNRDRIEYLTQRQQGLSDYGLKAVDYSSVKVQSSPDTSIVESIVMRNQERQQKLRAEIIKLALEIDDILQLIEDFTNNGVLSKLLYLKYGQNMTMKEVSAELQYDYKYCCTLHTKAINELQKYLDETQRTA